MDERERVSGKTVTLPPDVNGVRCEFRAFR
jgi:hypothetical protein